MSHQEHPIDWKKVEDLAIAGCLGTEIASYIGVHHETFYQRVQKKYGMACSAYLYEKRARGESILRAQQYAKALGLTDKGDNTLLIWLGKNRLKQSDNGIREEDKAESKTDIENRSMAQEALLKKYKDKYGDIDVVYN